MHYRNGREAKNGDKIVKLEGGKVVSFGVLHSAVPGNDYCNGNIAAIQPPNDYACMCDCLHVDDVAEVLAGKGLDKRPSSASIASPPIVAFHHCEKGFVISIDGEMASEQVMGKLTVILNNDQEVMDLIARKLQAAS